MPPFFLFFFFCACESLRLATSNRIQPYDVPCAGVRCRPGYKSDATLKGTCQALPRAPLSSTPSLRLTLAAATAIRVEAELVVDAYECLSLSRNPAVRSANWVNTTCDIHCEGGAVRSGRVYHCNAHTDFVFIYNRGG